MIKFKAFTQADWEPYMGAEPFSTGEEPIIAWIEKSKDEWWDIVIDRYGVQVHNSDGDSFIPVGSKFSEINYSDTAGYIERINRDANFLDNVQKYWQMI